MTTPLPFTCSHEHYQAGVEDDWGNTEPEWAAPVTVPCFWWLPESTEPAVPDSGGVRTAVDVVLVVDSELVVDPKDYFTIDGRRFEVIGLPKDYDHGPFGYQPNRKPIELKWVG